MAMAKVGGTNTQLSACAAVPHWQELGQTAQNRCSCASHMVLLACRHKQRWNIQSFLFRAIFIWTWQLNCINLEDCLESTGFPLLRKATSCTYPFHIGFRNHEKEKETVPPKKKRLLHLLTQLFLHCSLLLLLVPNHQPEMDGLPAFFITRGRVRRYRRTTSLIAHAGSTKRCCTRSGPRFNNRSF